MNGSAEADLRFRRCRRLRRPAEFDRLKREGVAKYAGPLRVAGAPNGTGHNRLGLAVSRRVGGAVRRNRIKRRLREAFRLTQHALPTGYDLAVSAKAHDDATLDEYRQWLTTAVQKIDKALAPKPNEHRPARQAKPATEQG